VVGISKQILWIVRHGDERRFLRGGRRPVPEALSIAISSAQWAVEPVAEERGMHGRELLLEVCDDEVDERAERRLYELEPAPERPAAREAKSSSVACNTPEPEPGSLAAAWMGRRGVAQGPPESGIRREIPRWDGPAIQPPRALKFDAF
jgi:hypothetical protein